MDLSSFKELPKSAYKDISLGICLLGYFIQLYFQKSICISS